MIPENDDIVLAAARNTDFSDFEDSMQNESAMIAGVDYIITRNKKDFDKSTVSDITPEEFLKLVLAEK
ncbi:MAG: hypothetical protein PUI24_04570 [Spirochaetales bacterium]|nr:hypothetical protein [Spirochaetales bacterium]